MIKWELKFSVFTICCWCWGKGLNPAGWVAIGGPLAGTEAKFLKDKSCYETFLRSGHNLLAAGPKLRLLARLARLESRSPVTSLLSVEVGVIKVLTPPEPEQSRQYHMVNIPALTVVVTLSEDIIKVIIRYKGTGKWLRRNCRKTWNDDRVVKLGQVWTRLAHADLTSVNDHLLHIGASQCHAKSEGSAAIIVLRALF